MLLLLLHLNHPPVMGGLHGKIPRRISEILRSEALENPGRVASQIESSKASRAHFPTSQSVKENDDKSSRKYRDEVRFDVEVGW